MTLGVEQHVDWAVDCLDYLRSRDVDEIETEIAAEGAWVAHDREVGEASLRSTRQSWYHGSNVAGKPKVFSPYVGGIPVYSGKIEAVRANGYSG